MTVSPCSTNCRVPIDSEPVYVPLAAAENVSLNVTDEPGAMLIGFAGASKMAKPAPETRSRETATAL